MEQVNYFQILCLFWAALGIGSRILMKMLGTRWKKWELTSAYSSKRPRWVVWISVLGFLLIVYTWYAVFTLNVPHSWILALFVTATGFKLYLLLFNYQRFRMFAQNVLNDRQKWFYLNAGVIAFSVLYLSLAVFVY